MARKLGEFSNVKNWIESLGLLWVLPIFYNSNSAFYWTNLYLNLLKKIEGFNIFFCGKRGKLARFLIRTLRLFFLRMEKEFSILKDLVIQSIFSTKLMEAFKINIKIRFIFYINEHIAFISLYKSRYKFYKNLLYEWNYMFYFDSTWRKGILWEYEELYELLKIPIYR